MIVMTWNISFGLFLVSFVTALAGVIFTASWRWRLALILLVLGWLSLAASLGLRWQIADRPPLSNQYESMLLLLWSFIAMYFMFLSFTFPALEWMTPWIAGFALLIMGVVSLLDSSIEPLVPALQSNWLLIHVTTTLLGYAAFVLAFLGGSVYLTLRYTSYQKDKRESLDTFLYRSCMLGFWLLTLGIITGAVWANAAWGSYWSWDPKETWALITWIFYVITIHLRRTRGWREERFAWLTIAGFGFVIFTYFGVNYLLSGLHAYA